MKNIVKTTKLGLACALLSCIISACNNGGGNNATTSNTSLAHTNVSKSTASSSSSSGSISSQYLNVTNNNLAVVVTDINGNTYTPRWEVATQSTPSTGSIFNAKYSTRYVGTADGYIVTITKNNIYTHTTVPSNLPVQSMALSSNSKYLLALAGNATSSTVFAFPIDSSGSLESSQIKSSAVAIGSNSIALSADNSAAVITNAMTNSISTLRYDNSNGTLTLINTFYNSKESSPAAAIISTDNKNIYVAESNVAIVNIYEENNTFSNLTLKGGIGTNGQHPISITTDKSGTKVLVGTKENSIILFDRETTQGLLKTESVIPVDYTPLGLEFSESSGIPTIIKTYTDELEIYYESKIDTYDISESALAGYPHQPLEYESTIIEEYQLPKSSHPFESKDFEAPGGLSGDHAGNFIATIYDATTHLSGFEYIMTAVSGIPEVGYSTYFNQPDYKPLSVTFAPNGRMYEELSSTLNPKENTTAIFNLDSQNNKYLISTAADQCNSNTDLITQSVFSPDGLFSYRIGGVNSNIFSCEVDANGGLTSLTTTYVDPSYSIPKAIATDPSGAIVAVAYPNVKKVRLYTRDASTDTLTYSSEISMTDAPISISMAKTETGDVDMYILMAKNGNKQEIADFRIVFAINNFIVTKAVKSFQIRPENYEMQSIQVNRYIMATIQEESEEELKKEPLTIFYASDDGDGYSGNLVNEYYRKTGIITPNGIQAADEICMDEAADTALHPNIPVGLGVTYKGFLVDNNNRTACSTPFCGGVLNQTNDWVLQLLSVYLNENQQILAITGINSLFSLKSPGIQFTNGAQIKLRAAFILDWWTGLQYNYTSSDLNCNQWSGGGNTVGNFGGIEDLHTATTLDNALNIRIRSYLSQDGVPQNMDCRIGIVVDNYASAPMGILCVQQPNTLAR